MNLKVDKINTSSPMSAILFEKLRINIYYEDSELVVGELGQEILARNQGGRAEHFTRKKGTRSLATTVNISPEKKTSERTYSIIITANTIVIAFHSHSGWSI